MPEPFITVTLFVVRKLLTYLSGKAIDYATLTHWENQYNDRSIFPDRRRREARQLKHCIELLKSGNATAAREALKLFGNECINHTGDSTWLEIGHTILSFFH